MKISIVILILVTLVLGGVFFIAHTHMESNAISGTTSPSGISIKASNAQGADIQIWGIHITANSSGANIQVPGLGSIGGSQQGARIEAQNGTQQINVNAQSK